MSQLFRLFLDIALLKKGPQDVPYSVFLLVVLFLLVTLIDVVGLLLPGPKGETLSTAVILRYLLVANATIIGVVYLIFKAQNLVNRLVQSLTAMFGTQLLLSMIQLPMNYFIVQSLMNENSGALLLLVLMQMLLFIWGIIIYYHIVKQALSASVFYAIAISMGLFSLGLFLQGLLLPEIAA